MSVVCKVQHQSACLSQTKNALKSVSQDDLTTSKLTPDNNTNKTDPPNEVEEAKREVVSLVDTYYL